MYELCTDRDGMQSPMPCSVIEIMECGTQDNTYIAGGELGMGLFLKVFLIGGLGLWAVIYRSH